MRLKKYSSEGLVLAKANLFEADRIVIIFTKDFGKIPYIARGVRKPVSRKRGSLEVFNHIKFLAARGKHFDILLESEIVNNYKLAREDLKKITVAYFFIETIGRITREEEENVVLFQYLKKMLNGLGKVHNLKKYRHKFIQDVLVILGFLPKTITLDNPDEVLKQVLEKELNTYRVAKKILT